MADPTETNGSNGKSTEDTKKWEDDGQRGR